MNWFRKPSVEQVLKGKLLDTQLALLSAADQREYWQAIEQMYIDREDRLLTDLAALKQELAAGASVPPAIFAERTDSDSLFPLLRQEAEERQRAVQLSHQ